MRITYFTHYYVPEGNAPATRVSALSRRWVRDGHEVTVITGIPNVPNGIAYEGYKNKRLPQIEVIDGVKVVRLWTWLSPNSGIVRRILNFLSYMLSAVLYSLIHKRPDVIIATSPQFFCGWAGVLAKWRYRLTAPFSKRPRFVLEIRDIWPESIGAVGAMNRGVIFRFLEFLEKRMYAAAHHIVTVGNGYRRVLMERGVDRDKISVITNGVDIEQMQSQERNPDEFRKKWGLENKFICSYVGTIGMASGLHIFLRAAKELKRAGREDIALVAVGDGAIRNELEDSAKSESLDNVVFTGRCEKKDIVSVLDASDVCCVHLRKTPLFSTVIPSKIFEAMQMARPILIGVDGDARDIIEKSGCGLAIEPENESDLVRELVNLADMSEQKRHELGRLGHAYVGDHFDLDVLAKKYLQCLVGLI